MYGSSFEVSLVDSYDFFTDKYKNIYMHKILNYIRYEFSGINLLQVNLFDELVKEIDEDKEIDMLFFELVRGEERSDKLLVKYSNYGGYSGKRTYHINENISIGSELSLDFRKTFPEPGDFVGLNDFNSKYLVRNIPVNASINSSWVTSYVSLDWNFESPESDKVLKISRDKFIEGTIKEYKSILRERILPEVVVKVLNLFEKYRNNTNSLTDANEYFFTELTAKMLGVNTNSLRTIYRNFKIPQHVATKINESPIDFIEFLDAKKIETISINKSVSKVSTRSLATRGFRDIIKNTEIITDVVYWEAELFNPYLNKMHYQLSSIYTKRYKTDVVTIRVYETSNKFLFVKSDEISLELFWAGSVPISGHTSRRNILVPMKEYSELICTKSRFDSFQLSGTLGICSHYIVSPFKSRNELYAILEHLKNESFYEKEEIKAFIKHFYLKELIPNKLIKFIIDESSSDKKDLLNENNILNGYLELIVDIVLYHIPKDSKLLN